LIERNFLRHGAWDSSSHLFKLNLGSVYLEWIVELYEKHMQKRKAYDRWISLQVKIFGFYDLSDDSFESFTNVDNLLGANVMNGNVDVHRMAMNDIVDALGGSDLFVNGKLRRARV
jgi:hypothetical protein